MAERSNKRKGMLWLLLLLGGAGALVAASGSKKITTPVAETHKECVGGFCVELVGAGPNLCLVDGDCIVPPETHKECQNNSCVSVLGAGADLCALDADCAASTPKHTKCIGGVCSVVEGAGADECSTDQDCVVSPTHKECQNGSCVTVLGEGIDVCSLDGDCVAPPVNPCTVLSQKVTNNPPTPMGIDTDVKVEITNSSTTTFQMNLTMFDFGTDGTGAANFDPITTEKLITVPPGKSTHTATPMTRVDVNPSQLSVVLYKTTDGKACVSTLVDFINDPATTPLSCSLSLVSNKDLVLTVDASVLGGAEPYDIAILWGDGDVTQVNLPGQYSHTYPNEGTTDIVLDVKDNVGATCNDALQNVVITPPPVNCSATLVSQFGSTITIDIAVTSGTAPYSIIMDFGDGIAIGTNTPGQHNHTYAQPGTYNVTIDVTDKNFDTCSDTIPNIVVEGSGGGALSCTFTFLSKNGMTANFNIDVQGGNTPYNISVEWGDGKVSTGLSEGVVSHTYASTGTKFPTLVVGNAGTNYPDGDCFDLVTVGI